MKHITFLFFIILTSCSQKPNPSQDSSELKLEMDFIKNKKIIYSYSINGEDEFTSEDSEHKSKTNINGQLVISSENDTTANVETVGLEIEVLDFDGTGYKESFKNKIANTRLSGMNNLGVFTSKNNDFSTDLYFPLSGKSTKVGDTFEREIKTPINIDNSIVYSTGNISITVVEIKDYGKGLSAKLNGVIKISLQDIPENIEGKQKHYLTGNCDYIFNLEKGYFEEINIPMKLNQITTQILNFENKSIPKENKININSIVKLKLLETK